jgi:flagellar capping protein FliD
MDQIAGKMNTMLGRYTGMGSTTGYVANQIASIDSQLKDMGTDITDLTASLADRETSLTDQYAVLQSQLINMAYAQQTWQSIYNGSNSG